MTETRVENRSVKKQEEIESTWVGISDNAVGRHCFVSTRTKCTDREREREREREALPVSTKDYDETSPSRELRLTARESSGNCISVISELCIGRAESNLHCLVVN